MHTANYEPWFATGRLRHADQSGRERTRSGPKTRSWRPLRRRQVIGLAPGHPGEPNAKAAEVLSKYLIGNMFAGAIKGQ